MRKAGYQLVTVIYIFVTSGITIKELQFLDEKAFTLALMKHSR